MLLSRGDMCCFHFSNIVNLWSYYFNFNLQQSAIFVKPMSKYPDCGAEHIVPVKLSSVLETIITYRTVCYHEALHIDSFYR